GEVPEYDGHGALLRARRYRDDVERVLARGGDLAQHSQLPARLPGERDDLSDDALALRAAPARQQSHQLRYSVTVHIDNGERVQDHGRPNRLTLLEEFIDPVARAGLHLQRREVGPPREVGPRRQVDALAEQVVWRNCGAGLGRPVARAGEHAERL